MSAPGLSRQELPSGAYARNLRVVGYSDLNGKPAFKLDLQQVGDRWYLYLGHFWDPGWSILDVTDPSAPQVCAFVPGPTNTSTGQMMVAQGRMVTALERKAPDWGGDPHLAFDEGVLVWDLANPTQPRLLSHWRTHGTGTHRNFYDGGSFIHLAAGMPGYSGNIYVIVDISDPTRPSEAGRWWVPGQHETETNRTSPAVSLHGPAYVEANLAYLPYGAAGLVILDISDINHPKRIGGLTFSPPFVQHIGVHGALPLPSRRIAVVNSEAIAEDCQEALNHASIVDISDPSNPVLLSLLPVPSPPPDAPYRTFCDKGGRFGPHNLNHHHHNPWVERRDDRVYLTYFNAGLRVFDISEARLPAEIGYFIPPDPTRRYGPKPERVLAAQTEDVLVDTRGYIYLTHKNQGLWVLRADGG